jgi:hypothetical protein
VEEVGGWGIRVTCAAVHQQSAALDGAGDIGVCFQNCSTVTM